jgi:hypothetical protein
VRRILLILGVLALGVAAARADDIPENLQGRWVLQGEACDASGQPITLSATNVVYSDGRLDDVQFFPDDGKAGAIRVNEEAQVYEYVVDDDVLLFRPEGFGMGAPLRLLRCHDMMRDLERHCGWLGYLVQGEWTLTDRFGRLTLLSPGNDSVESTAKMDMLPDFDPDEFVPTAKQYYGYGCACMTVSTDGDRVTTIASVRRQPLATCEADPNLPRP